VVELLAVLAVLGLLLSLLVPAVQASREASRSIECRNHLHQWGVALNHFESVRKRFPGCHGVAVAPGPLGLQSPHVGLLHYLELASTANQFVALPVSLHIGELAWYSGPDWAHETIPVFLCPSDAGPWGTNYVFCTGSSLGIFGGSRAGVFSQFSGLRAAEVVDGISNTAAVSEQLISPPNSGAFDRRVHYWFSGAKLIMPADSIETTLESLCQSPGHESAPYDRTDGWEWYIGSYGRTWYNHTAVPNATTVDCSAEGWPTLSSTMGIHPARSWHPGGVNVLVLDGSARIVSNSVDETVWSATATVAGGEPQGVW
jgi:prepilin-type processing-associated H-X9-DG protein